jgi:glycosyltransferase involved in cell wall biosynthesis
MLTGAWRAARRTYPDLELWLAGLPRPAFPPCPPEPGLRVLGYVPDADLPALYSGAVAAVYPSLYEGFGLPVLEALQCGALVIASRDPAVAEVAGDAAVLADARDPQAWTEAICAAAAGSCAAVRARACSRAAQFSWRDTARRTREVYAEARRRNGR